MSVLLLPLQRHRPLRTWATTVSYVVLVFHMALFGGASAQCSFGGVETYEKTSGTTVMCDGDGCSSRGLLAQPESAVTRDCIAICKQSTSCTSFTVGE